MEMFGSQSRLRGRKGWPIEDLIENLVTVYG